MRLSIVATLYCSAPYLPEFYRRASETARRFAGDDYEIVLVNDGSPDESLRIAVELQERDPRLRVVDLSRNFGHHQAMWTGLQFARGALVFLLDSDLEEAPEWLAQLDGERLTTGADVVFGVQESRGEGWFNRMTGWAFYRLFNCLSTVTIPENLMTIRLMSRRYVDALLQHTEAVFVISALWARTGFLQVPLPLPKGRKPSTTYSLVRRVKMLVNSVTASSEAPLFAVFYLGLTLLVTSSLVAVNLVLGVLFYGKMLAGWPSLMVSIWFLGGLCLFCQGVLGIYLARVFQETKRRPLALVRQVYETEGARDVPARAA